MIFTVIRVVMRRRGVRLRRPVLGLERVMLLVVLVVRSLLRLRLRLGRLLWLIGLKVRVWWLWLFAIGLMCLNRWLLRVLVLSCGGWSD